MLRLLLIVLTTALSFTSYSSVTVNGNFKANKTCPAYVSKNNKNGPNALAVHRDERYELREINRPLNPDWLRIQFNDESEASGLRWVHASCGDCDYQDSGKTICDESPGLADSNVLALSWQPGFCETYGYEAGKPECTQLKAQSYQANHLVLHGLWPNQDVCGQHYGFCGVQPQPHHCDYSPVNLNSSVAMELRQLMPSYTYGSCLERHEWNKHGSCQALSANDYFTLAIRLTKEMDKTALGDFLRQHQGETITRGELRDEIAHSFGKEANTKVYLGCKNGILVDVYIQLPALIPQTSSLQALIKEAPSFARYDACPVKITISDFNSETWY